jgi:hypothetical protein
MIYLYTNKQIFGAFILLVYLMILILVNIGIGEIGNIFSIPVIISILTCIILYYINLKKSIDLRTKSMLDLDNFKMNNCPSNYTRNSEGEGEGEIISCNLTEGSEGEGIIQNFILSSGTDKSSCITSDDFKKYGCFNKFHSRQTKCSKIEKFFKNSEGNIEYNKNTLTNWTDFQNECK